ncbi:MAG TPA: bifunctional rhamnulose-1-phosphate aldolase/short-chain dehydrogenase, partial [bacterium]|nr:bifunctional rhamnulose-1-phosphate aldolase/short-chain dehydrogenase [bacterium]
MKNLWSSEQAAKCEDKLDLLVYSSRLIGSEPSLCVWGGGNTSTKITLKDHAGRDRRVLCVKGSGSDLKASTRRDFPPVALDELLEVFDRDKMTDEEMVDYVSRCLLEPKAPRPSIEVLLHAFVDQADIHHTHADAILSITNTEHGQKITQKVFDKELLWVPYVKPGFTLAKWVGQAYRKNPSAKGVILEKHGLITWAGDGKTSYSRTIEMVSRAERFLAKAKKKKKYWSPPAYWDLLGFKKEEWLVQNLPRVRSVLSTRKKVVLFVNPSRPVMEFINAKDAARVSQAGPATPDHMLRTKRTPLYVNVPPAGIEKLTAAALRRQIEDYAARHKRYFETYKHFLPQGEYSKMQDPYPKVILVPGIGMITSGADLKNAKIISEIYEHSISVMENASRIDRYDSLSEKLAFEMDYWPMELYKLSLAPPESEFSRQIGLVTGAARGIGRAIAGRLAALGAHVFLSDINAKALGETVKEINESLKAERAFPLLMDVTKPESVKKGFEKMILTCGGLDFLVSNAGIAHVSSIENLLLEDWQKSFAVNATGHFLVSQEAVKIMKQQGKGGALVFIVTKNVPAPGKDFGAYSAAKAAQAQLARVLAIENGPEKIRVNMIHPDGVFEDSGLWEKIGKNRAKSYGISGKTAEFLQRPQLDED